MTTQAAPRAATHASQLPDLLKPAEVAAYLRTTIGAVYYMVERAQLPAACIHRQGRKLLFRRDELLKHVGVQR